MMRRDSTIKQRKYANNLMNTNLSRAEAMREAGYSDKASSHPARVEDTAGFKLAMSGIFTQSGNVSMAILNELDAKIQAGELKKEKTSELVKFFDVMTRAMERMIPKEPTKEAKEIKSIFANVIDVTPDTEKPLQNKDNLDVAIDTQENI